jgi:hypothetical protein
MIAARPWLALALMGVAIASAIGALAARSLFVTCMHVLTSGISVAAATLLLRAGDGGLALALFATAWAPVLLMAAMLLSARATKATRRRLPWLSILGAATAACAIWWPLLELSAAAPVTSSYALAGLGFWLAPVVLAAAAGCVGMLGYGERGPFTRGPLTRGPGA